MLYLYCLGIELCHNSLLVKLIVLWKQISRHFATVCWSPSVVRSPPPDFKNNWLQNFHVEFVQISILWEGDSISPCNNHFPAAYWAIGLNATSFKQPAFKTGCSARQLHCSRNLTVDYNVKSKWLSAFQRNIINAPSHHIQAWDHFQSRDYPKR